MCLNNCWADMCFLVCVYRIFEFRKIIGDREKCKYLVPEDYPVYINKVLHLFSHHCSPVSLLSCSLTVVILCPDRGACRLSYPRWVLHLSPGALGSGNPATRGRQSQVENTMLSPTSADVMMSQQQIWSLLTNSSIRSSDKHNKIKCMVQSIFD